MNAPTTDQPALTPAAAVPEEAPIVPTTPPLTVPRDVRRANRLLLAGMVLFAVALAAACFLWMYGRMMGQREAERAASDTYSRQTEPTPPANPSPSPVAPR